MPAIENGGGGQGGQGGVQQPSQPPGLQEGQTGEKQDQMSKKPTRRPGVKPPPDRAKRSIYLFSLKNPIRQLFIKVNFYINKQNKKKQKIGVNCFDDSPSLLLA